MTSQQAILSPAAMIQEFKKNGVTHVVCLPDSETNYLYEMMEADPSLDIVPVAREGETMAIAAGLLVGGKLPVCLIQNTGMLESGDSIRGLALDLNLPMVLIIGYRGWTRHGVTPDSAARFTEPFLQALNINYYLVETDEDAPRISTAFQEAKANNRPVAVLIGDEYHGFNRPTEWPARPKGRG
ncbi:MAG: thiamine pyrophosphate-binding protein [Dehalococcoidia bacterium]|nr:thiamine pyrophosphate-binding protein [Dehalococcoidia bacterium]